jgi:hypothetical protein
MLTLRDFVIEDLKFGLLLWVYVKKTWIFVLNDSQTIYPIFKLIIDSSIKQNNQILYLIFMLKNSICTLNLLLISLNS